jgi:hypothetical protein
MKGHLQIIDAIRTQLESEEFVNTISEGSLFDIDLNKVTIFPLVHLIVNNYAFEGKVIKCNISILYLDLVDVSKKEVTDIFVGNDNKQYVQNTAVLLLNRIYQQLVHGSLYDLGYQCTTEPTVEIWEERFENYLAGGTLTVDITFFPDMTIC